ncbi:anti-sigma factor domain-containing protein [Scopulibacillus cellulosilyticus]|uniref:Anti-sigma factor domain-containing protein n=1 Tax=Scopulibacillus cellulosilyticus TaxID=2665665 RepID=A0ABW2PU56_9BACL
MGADCHWPEEELVDYVLGNEDKALKRHLEFCKSCQEKIEEWREALLRESYEYHTPSSKIKSRIKRTIRVSKTRKGRRDSFLQMPWAVVTGCLCFVFFVLIIDRTAFNSHTSEAGIIRSQLAVQSKDISSGAVPDQNSHVNSYFLINRVNREAVVYVNGLRPLRSHDYQVWFVCGGKKENAGVLKFNQGIARMHIRGGQINKLDYILITIEPKGGSRVQAGPKTFEYKL